MHADGSITARAPAKVILFGEHAINRGQPALAASVGLYATCRLAPRVEGDYVFRSGAYGDVAPRVATAGREEIRRLAGDVDAWRGTQDYESIRRLAGADYYAPAKYILATAFGQALPAGLSLAIESEIPPAGGLGSGGAAFAALACALAAWTGTDDGERIADWAHRGDVIAHGGVASRLDTQTSLCGGVIRFVAGGRGNPGAGPQAPEGGLGEPIPWAPGLTLVIGNTNVVATTSEVNSRVRSWLGASPRGRMRYFEAIGVLSRAALEPLRTGGWGQLGHLMTLNQLLLEKIGVSSPEIERLVAAALEGGALGAKLAGSGGGGIVVALAPPDAVPAVVAAITRAGGDALTPTLGVPGAAVVASHDCPY